MSYVVRAVYSDAVAWSQFSRNGSTGCYVVGSVGHVARDAIETVGIDIASDVGATDSRTNTDHLSSESYNTGGARSGIWVWLDTAHKRQAPADRTSQTRVV